jgi:hypothetical protein
MGSYHKALSGSRPEAANRALVAGLGLSGHPRQRPADAPAAGFEILLQAPMLPLQVFSLFQGTLQLLPELPDLPFQLL